MEMGIPVLQPEKLRDPDFLAALRDLQPDLAVVVAFRMLPREVWALPTRGTFNLHASLLPDYRGAAPINWAIINGESETGLTTFFLDEKIDTGPLLLQTQVAIPREWNAGDLHDCLMEKGATLVLETVKQIAAGSVIPQPQNTASAMHPAPKIFRENCRIQWQQTAEQVRNHIRGLSPYPAAWTSLGGLTLKVYAAETADLAASPGALLIREGELFIGCAQGALHLTQVQIEGKKRMSGAEFLRGWKGTVTQTD